MNLEEANVLIVAIRRMVEHDGVPDDMQTNHERNPSQLQAHVIALEGELKSAKRKIVADREVFDGVNGENEELHTQRATLERQLDEANATVRHLQRELAGKSCVQCGGVIGETGRCAECDESNNALIADSERLEVVEAENAALRTALKSVKTIIRPWIDGAIRRGDPKHQPKVTFAEWDKACEQIEGRARLSRPR